MIIKYLVHATIHLAIDIIASGSLIHQMIDLPVCAQRTLVFGSASSPPSLACPLSSRKSCAIGSETRPGTSSKGPAVCICSIYMVLDSLIIEARTCHVKSAQQATYWNHCSSIRSSRSFVPGALCQDCNPPLHPPHHHLLPQANVVFWRMIVVSEEPGRIGQLSLASIRHVRRVCLAARLIFRPGVED
jgi:hypothetical protein